MMHRDQIRAPGPPRTAHRMHDKRRWRRSDSGSVRSGGAGVLHRGTDAQVSKGEKQRDRGDERHQPEEAAPVSRTTLAVSAKPSAAATRAPKMRWTLRSVAELRRLCDRRGCSRADDDHRIGRERVRRRRPAILLFGQTRRRDLGHAADKLRATGTPPTGAVLSETKSTPDTG
jgi:hypothetical protein